LRVFKNRVLRTNLGHRGKRQQEVEQKCVMWKYILTLFVSVNKKKSYNKTNKCSEVKIIYFFTQNLS